MANKKSTLENMVRVDDKFWANKKVFITGHTGFKGSWLSLWLQKLGANVKGFSLEPKISPSLYFVGDIGNEMESEIGDIRNFEKLKKSIVKFNPEIIFHLAAQPLVRYSYKNPIETYSTNVMGTLNVLEIAKSCSNLKSIVAITTDKCYENKEWAWGYRESDPMGGHDPYSSSKGCCELLISSYRSSFFNSQDTAFIASARAGNVIGGGDWSEDRLVPDILKSISKSQNIEIRNPFSIRPWQHVLEPLSGYLMLAEKLFKAGNQYSSAWNFGPSDDDCKSVSYIVNTMINYWGSDSKLIIDKQQQPHEANFLKLDISKAKNELNWFPKWDLNLTLKYIVNWHKEWLNNSRMKDLCLKEIDFYNTTI